MNKLVTMMLLLCLLHSAIAFSRDSEASEPKQKFWSLQAAWIYNIARFIEFPGNNMNTEVLICIIGNESGSVSEKLKLGIKGRTLQGKSIIVDEVAPENTKQCQLIYQTSGATEQISEVHADQAWISAPGSSTHKHSLLSLRLSGNKLELLLNKKVLQQTNVKLNPSLLRLARPMEAVE